MDKTQGKLKELINEQGNYKIKGLEPVLES
jgi:hypothetical protein